MSSSVVTVTLTSEELAGELDMGMALGRGVRAWKMIEPSRVRCDAGC